MASQSLTPQLVLAVLLILVGILLAAQAAVMRRRRDALAAVPPWMGRDGRRQLLTSASAAVTSCSLGLVELALSNAIIGGLGATVMLSPGGLGVFVGVGLALYAIAKHKA